jgi:hypothetical protein
VSQFAQCFLVEDRDLPPLGRIVKRVGIDVVELAAIPRDGPCARERLALLLALDLRDVGADLGNGSGNVMAVTTYARPALA